MQSDQFQYKVIAAMTAFEDQEEGFTLTTHKVQPGEILASASKASRRWEGMEVVRALRGAIRLCVEVGEFRRCTEEIVSHVTISAERPSYSKRKG